MEKSMRLIQRNRVKGQVQDQDHAGSEGSKNPKGWIAGASIGMQRRNSDANREYLAGLNAQQRRAVRYGVTAGNATDVGPLLVIAGAGTGKTMTIAHRVAHLIMSGISPHRILLLTFTRRAAREMIRRVRGIASKGLSGAKLDLPCPAPFMPSVPAFCANTHIELVSSRPSPFLTGRTLLT
jgi:hypothetical protein